MTQTQGDLASLSRFIFRAPSWYSSIAFALLIAAITGVAAFDSRFILEDAYQGIFYVGIPTVVASLLTPWVDGKLGGQLTANRASLLALACELVIIAFLTVAGVVAVVSPAVPYVRPLGQEFVVDAMLTALASIYALRLLVIMAVSRQSLSVASITASIQTAVAAVLLFVYSGTMRYLEFGGGPLMRAFLYRPDEAPERIRNLQYVAPGKFVLLVLICLLYAGAVWLFLTVIDAPWRRSLGVSALDFLRGFIGHIAEGTRELEDFFEQMGEEAMVPVTVLSFRRREGGEKARFVLPMIHPGPMGDIGGGNLPERIAAQADGLAFPPHATAGHDFNLVTEREVDTICETAATAYQRIEYDATASESVRLTEGEATLTGQAFGDDALVVTTFSPNFADDVEYAVGLSAVSEARADGLDDVMLVDAHNCNNGLDGEDLGHVVPGSERSFDMIHGAGEVGSFLSTAEQGPYKLGTAWDETPWEPREGIGPLGIRVAVFEVPAEGSTGGVSAEGSTDDAATDGAATDNAARDGDGVAQRTAYVLVDGNNMEPGLREAIVDAVDAVDTVEVMTTDTHIVNTVEADNQVGQAIDDDELIALIQDLVDEAVADVEPVEGGMESEHAEVTVFGNDRTEMLASTANAAISLGMPLAVSIILAALSVSALIFLLASV